MRLSFVHRTRAKRIPNALRYYMKARFRVSDEYVDGLRCFEMPVVTGTARMKHLLVYCPSVAREHGVTVISLRDLEREPDMVFYDARLYAGGEIRMIDCRSPHNPCSPRPRAREASHKHLTRWF